MEQLDEIAKKAIDFASDVTKQLITLSTVILSLSTALVGKFFPIESLVANKALFIVTLSLFVASILFGILTLLSLTGKLGTEKEEITRKSIYDRKVRIFSALQMFFFLGALVLSVIFIGKSISEAETNAKQNNATESIEKAKCIKVIKTSEYAIEGVRIDTLYLTKNL